MEKRVGIRELKQNPSQVIDWAKSGSDVLVTERGIAVAKISALQNTPLVEQIQTGEVTLPKLSLAELISKLPTAVPVLAEQTNSNWLEESRADKF